MSKMGNPFSPSRLVSYSENDILAEIKRVSLAYFGGRYPRTKDFDKHARVHSGTVINRFGSWKQAMARAGIAPPVRQLGTQIDRPALESELSRIKRLCNNKYFTEKEYVDKGGRYCIASLKKGLGHSTWANLLRGILSIEKEKKIRILVRKARPSPPTDEQLLAEMGRVWVFFGRRPSYSEFKAKGRIGRKVYEKRFGSWTKAIEWFCQKSKVALQQAPKTHVTPELLLSELRAIATRCKTTVVPFKTYKKLGGAYSIGTFQHHFGRWANVLARLNLQTGHTKPEYAQKYANEDLFKELQRLWEVFGRQPKAREMDRLGSISAQTFENRFGSWMKAIHAFCNDRANEGASQLQPQEVVKTPPVDAVLPISAVDNGERKQTNATRIYIKKTPRQPSPRLRWKVMCRDRFTCVKCGRSPASAMGVELQVDHIDPYSADGETVLDNLRTLCKECNQGKSDSRSDEEDQ